MLENVMGVEEKTKLDDEGIETIKANARGNYF